MGNLLVVSTTDVPRSLLMEHVAPDDTVQVVVPVIRQSLLDWLANDQRAFAAAERIAQRTAERLPVEPVAAKPGEADVELAIRDALATFPADEIVVAVADDGERTSVDEIVLRSEGMSSFDGVPLRWIVIGPAAARTASGRSDPDPAPAASDQGGAAARARAAAPGDGDRVG